MSEEKTKYVFSGLGFSTILGLIFITLKLCSVITWSWWLVLLPLYAGAAIVISLAVAILSIYLIIMIFVGLFGLLRK